MDCRFCCVRPATHLSVPTNFGLVELCDGCAKEYGRRWGHSGRDTNTRATGSPATAARCEFFPDQDSNSRPRNCPDDQTHSTQC